MTVTRRFGRRHNRPKSRRHAHIHAARRAQQRLGLVLTLQELDALADGIAEGKARFVARESINRATWVVRYQGRDMKVVYQRGLRAILTVYSLDMPTRGEILAAEEEAVP